MGQPDGEPHEGLVSKGDKPETKWPTDQDSRSPRDEPFGVDVAIIKQSSQPVSSANYFDKYNINAYDAIIAHLSM